MRAAPFRNGTERARMSTTSRVREKKAGRPKRRTKRTAKTTHAKKPVLASAERLLHELEVHRVELEMQSHELERARLEVEASLARYTEIFEFAPIGYVLLDPDWLVREINHAGARLLGRDRVRLVGRRFESFMASPSRDDFNVVMHRASRALPNASCEITLDIENAVRYVRITASMLPHARRVVLLTFVDISEAREREAKLEAADLALREAERRKDDFMSALSHELRNPLGPIRNSVFVLERAQNDPVAARAAREIIDRQARQLSRLVDDLLDVTRITRGKIRLQLERVELGEVVLRAVEDHRSSFDASGLVLSVTAEPELWVNADPARIVQIVSNVLGNAEKFTPRGGSVKVTVRRDGPCGTITVTDSGVGIHSELMAHLFEPFSQAPQTVERARGGLGLGLALVKGLIELHSGSVEIVSAGSGSGTIVRASLPMEERLPEVAPSPAHARDATSRNVLIIEDNVDAARSLCSALSVLGHEVRVANTGRSGIALARDFGPDILICDIGLPDLDGFQVATSFRADPELRTCYLVALTGYAQPKDIARAAETGFDRHLAKPAAIDLLAELVSNVQRVRS
ncbi:MAG TPA: ATP-binding protein [Kofleriaceae bacterium]